MRFCAVARAGTHTRMATVLADRSARRSLDVLRSLFGERLGREVGVHLWDGTEITVASFRIHAALERAVCAARGAHAAARPQSGARVRRRLARRRRQLGHRARRAGAIRHAAFRADAREARGAARPLARTAAQRRRAPRVPAGPPPHEGARRGGDRVPLRSAGGVLSDVLGQGPRVLVRVLGRGRHDARRRRSARSSITCWTSCACGPARRCSTSAAVGGRWSSARRSAASGPMA